jgi:hypothetical protein
MGKCRLTIRSRGVLFSINSMHQKLQDIHIKGFNNGRETTVSYSSLNMSVFRSFHVLVYQMCSITVANSHGNLTCLNLHSSALGSATQAPNLLGESRRFFSGCAGGHGSADRLLRQSNNPDAKYMSNKDEK